MNWGVRSGWDLKTPALPLTSDTVSSSAKWRKAVSTSPASCEDWKAMHVKHPAECLAHNKHSIDTTLYYITMDRASLPLKLVYNPKKSLVLWGADQPTGSPGFKKVVWDKHPSPPGALSGCREMGPRGNSQNLERGAAGATQRVCSVNYLAPNQC